MRIVIYATEEVYKGSHGVYDICVTEIDALEEAEELAEQMAYELLDSYARLWDPDEDLSDHGTDWEFARIMPQWDDIPTEALDAEAAEIGYDAFINKYCKFEGMDEFLAALEQLQQADGVGHTVVGKYTINTCFEGKVYETAIWIDPDRMAIPATYPNRASAEWGHKFWCIAAAGEPTQVWDTATKTYMTL